MLQSSEVTVVVTSRVKVFVVVTVENSVTTWFSVKVVVSVMVWVTVCVSVTPGSVTVIAPMVSVVVETGPLVVTVTVGPFVVTVVRAVVVAVHLLGTRSFSHEVWPGASPELDLPIWAAGLSSACLILTVVAAWASRTARPGP